jgi:threonine aldolase
MPKRVLDFRSDTVTKPTPGMRKAMAEAAVGDDVFDEDPSVHALQERVADLLGKEAAVFVPSGSMSNQIGVRVHCDPGDEFICESGCHIYNYEQGAYAQLSGLATRTVDGVCGVLQLEQLTGLIRADNEHLCRTRLVCLENTHNRGAGRIQPYDVVESICDWAHANGLRTHLDGARLFNAVVASGISARDWAQHFDTVSVCFSKGLGAPVGSALAGTKEHIKKARRVRKLFGGGMRQAGIIAAGALYALEHPMRTPRSWAMRSVTSRG